MSKRSEYTRGVLAAATIADGYNSMTTHRHRLGDCIASKLNQRKRKPRKNRARLLDPADQWIAGFACALAVASSNGADRDALKRAARDAAVTIAEARRVGVDPYDLKELRRIGVAKV